jgi:hypothetical protein
MDQQTTVITTMLSEKYLVSALEERIWWRSTGTATALIRRFFLIGPWLEN